MGTRQRVSDFVHLVVERPPPHPPCFGFSYLLECSSPPFLLDAISTFPLEDNGEFLQAVLLDLEPGGGCVGGSMWSKVPWLKYWEPHLPMGKSQSVAFCFTGLC